MGIRKAMSATLRRSIGEERTAGVRRWERRARSRLIDRLDVEGRRPVQRKAPSRTAAPARPKPMTREELIEAHGRLSGEGMSHPDADSLPFADPDPFASFPRPAVHKHEVLRRLHELLQPRTYLEIGVSTGASLALSRSRSIAVDPAFTITAPIRCDVHVVRATSDDFFAAPDAFDHLGGTPVDLAFIDGMHLAEYALRDFMNTEKHMAPGGVVVIDDMLPRNSLEASRIRRTLAWAGDVYKIHEVLRKFRPDLTIIPVTSRPTGSYLVVGLDPTSTVLDEHYPEIEAMISTPDPQAVPQAWLERRDAVDAETLLGSDVWSRLAQARHDAASDLSALWVELAALPAADR